MELEFELEDDVAEMLEKISAKTGKSEEEILREALNKFLSKAVKDVKVKE